MITHTREIADTLEIQLEEFKTLLNTILNEYISEEAISQNGSSITESKDDEYSYLTATWNFLNDDMKRKYEGVILKRLLEDSRGYPIYNRPAQTPQNSLTHSMTFSFKKLR